MSKSKSKAKSSIRARGFALLAKERQLGALFRLPSMLAAPRRTRPAFQFVNLAGALCLSVQSDFPSLAALQFQGQLGLASGQPRNPIGQISSFVMDSDCAAARRQGLPPFAFAPAWALPMQIFCVIWV